MGLSVIQSIVDVICMMGELIKSKIGIGVVRNNAISNKINSESEYVNTNAIGFSVDDSNWENDETEEDKLHSIGFINNNKYE
jgi:hypothetical protein